MTDREDALLVALQRGLPLASRPFARLGRRCGADERSVLAFVERLFSEGKARRLGAVFEPRRLGYESTLCAAAAAGDALDALLPLLIEHPGVTHLYERRPLPSRPALLPEAPPNLWFTLSAPAGTLADTMLRLRTQAGSVAVLDLPAVRRFKIDTVFSAAASGAAPGGTVGILEMGGPARAERLSEIERRIVRALQGSLPLTADPFGAAAEAVGIRRAQLLCHLKGWSSRGVLRRVGLVLRHRAVGVGGNALCAWPVEADQAVSAGLAVASQTGVTHCYERTPSPAFPLRLYAMVHAATPEAAAARGAEIGRRAGLGDVLALVSTKEYKKTSMAFFAGD